MSLTHTRLGAAVRVMRYYNSVPLTGTGIAPVRAGQTTSLLVVMIIGLNAGAFSGWKWESTAFVPGQISLFGRKDSPLKKAS